MGGLGTNNEITLNYMTPLIDELLKVANRNDTEAILTLKLYVFELFCDNGYNFKSPESSNDLFFEWYDYELMRILKRNQK